MPRASARAASSVAGARQRALGEENRPEPPHGARPQRPGGAIEAHLLGLGDARPHDLFHLRRTQRRSRQDTGRGGGAGDLGDGEEALAGESLVRFEDGAAPVRHQVFAGPAARFRDAIRIGEDEEGTESPSPGGEGGLPSRPSPPGGGMCAIRAQPSAILRMSAARGERSRRKRSTRSARSTASPPRPRSTRTAARSAASRAVSGERSAAARTMRASRGGRGSARSRRPLSVMRPSAIEGAELFQERPRLGRRPGRAADRGRRAFADRRRPRRRNRGRAAQDRPTGSRAGRRARARRSPPPPRAGSRRRARCGRRGRGAGRRRRARRAPSRAASGRCRARRPAPGRGRSRSPPARPRSSARSRRSRSRARPCAARAAPAETARSCSARSSAP